MRQGAPFEEREILILDLRQSVLTRYMNRAGRMLHRAGLGSPKASLSLSKRDTHP
jgi:hypothetical protein